MQIIRPTHALLAALIGVAGAMGSSPATAAPLQAPLQLRAAVPSLTQDVQYRRWHHRGHRHGWRHHGRRYHRDRWVGPAAGFAAGAIIGGALAAQPRAADADVAYCMERFRSYDPSSGTYLGYDGKRHSCP